MSPELELVLANLAAGGTSVRSERTEERRQADLLSFI